MKKDKYLRKRGGKAQMIYIVCAKCEEEVLYYQKDGIGYLHLALDVSFFSCCYLD